MASSPADAHIEPAVESSVTRLLVSIKQLLEALTQWSQLRVDENAVSDGYVRLGNDFNTAVFAFASYRIDMACVVFSSRRTRTDSEQGAPKRAR